MPRLLACIAVLVRLVIVIVLMGVLWLAERLALILVDDVIIVMVAVIIVMVVVMMMVIIIATHRHGGSECRSSRGSMRLWLCTRNTCSAASLAGCSNRTCRCSPFRCRSADRTCKRLGLLLRRSSGSLAGLRTRCPRRLLHGAWALLAAGLRGLQPCLRSVNCTGQLTSSSEPSCSCPSDGLKARVQGRA